MRHRHEGNPPYNPTWKQPQEEEQADKEKTKQNSDKEEDTTETDVQTKEENNIKQQLTDAQWELTTNNKLKLLKEQRNETQRRIELLEQANENEYFICVACNDCGDSTCQLKRTNNYITQRWVECTGINK